MRLYLKSPLQSTAGNEGMGASHGCTVDSFAGNIARIESKSTAPKA